ncbi:hypothetical protein EU546_05895 [Candidatus Thorarchaeota archaeon]|nr:MAG: hypothetical protein EU546_05895 [Candidatus Thorarchaeota archaeon]
MPAPKELEKLGGLFDKVTGRSKPFLDRCAQTKFLAVEDYTKAANEFIQLAKQTLNVEETKVNADCLDKVKNAVKSGQLDGVLVDELRRLRTSYLESVLRPAVKSYLTSEDGTIAEIESLYTNAVRIDGLLECLQFLSRVNQK